MRIYSILLLCATLIAQEYGEEYQRRYGSEFRIKSVDKWDAVTEVITGPFKEILGEKNGYIYFATTK